MGPGTVSCPGSALIARLAGVLVELVRPLGAGVLVEGVRPLGAWVFARGVRRLGAWVFARGVRRFGARILVGLVPAVAVGVAVGIGLAIAGGSAAHASRRDWTGSAACGACHPAQLAAWQVTPHARTRERFTSRPEARCLGCHATGEAPAGPVVAVEVGCEACHGAGAAYGEDDVMRDRPVALALGLVDLSTPKARAAACAPCHRTQTRSAPFDPTAPVHPISR